jgi:hygromycin-B 7''-O-kinase
MKRTRLLPRVTSWKSYGRVFTRPVVFRRAVTEVLRRHGLKGGRLGRTFPGTCAVFSVGRGRGALIVKLFPPMTAGDWEAEKHALARVVGRVPVPGLVASGTLHDRSVWRYLVLKSVPGVAFREARSRMPLRDLMAVMREVGKALRVVHRVRVRGPMPGRRVEWPARMREIAGQALRAYRESGMFTPHALEDMRRRLPPLLRPHVKPPYPLLHADLNEDHVLVRRSGGRWRFSGIIDWGDAEAGDPAYEWFPLWTGLMDRKMDRLHAFLEGYGHGLAMGSPIHGRRAGAFIAIHRFAPSYHLRKG